MLQSFAMRLTRTLIKSALQHYIDQQQQHIDDGDGAIADQNSAAHVDTSPPTPSPEPPVQRPAATGALHSPPVVRWTRDRRHHHSHHHQKPHNPHSHHASQHHHHHHRHHHHKSALSLYTEPLVAAVGAVSLAAAPVGGSGASSTASSAENIYDVPNVDSDDPQSATAAVGAAAVGSVAVPPTITTAPTPEATPHRTAGRSSSINACEIYDYDLYYRKPLLPLPASSSAAAAASYLQHNHHLDTVQRTGKKSALYSPLHCQPQPTGSNLSTANRPNSRNSLTSRLSSSHNSLSVVHTNKADDSIFITQAMSHDTLTGREISDFYNVPIDSDIYSLPVDMVVVRPASSRASLQLQLLAPTAVVAATQRGGKLRCPRAANRRRRKTRATAAPQPPTPPPLELELGVSDFNKYGSGTGNSQKVKALRTSAAAAAAEVKRYSVPEHVIEPMHMSLDEVKRFYHSLYSSSSDTAGSGTDCAGAPAPPPAKGGASGKRQQQQQHHVGGVRPVAALVHNNNSMHTNNNVLLLADGKSTATATGLNGRLAAASSVGLGTCKSASASATTTPASAATTPSASAAGAAVLTPIGRVGGTPTKKSKLRKGSGAGKDSSQPTAAVATSPANATDAGGSTAEKYGCAGKRSQFSITMNLKQKFCSIFRFRRSGTAHISGGGAAASAAAAGAAAPNGGGEYDRWNGASGGPDAKKAKAPKNMRFLTRALPPLPKRGLFSTFLCWCSQW